MDLLIGPGMWNFCGILWGTSDKEIFASYFMGSFDFKIKLISFKFIVRSRTVLSCSALLWHSCVSLLVSVFLVLDHGLVWIYSFGDGQHTIFLSLQGPMMWKTHSSNLSRCLEGIHAFGHENLHCFPEANVTIFFFKFWSAMKTFACLLPRTSKISIPSVRRSAFGFFDFDLADDDTSMALEMSHAQMTKVD
jgi:hypothetical protein